MKIHSGIVLDTHAFRWAFKKRQWTRVTKFTEVVRVKDRIVVHEVNRRKREFTGHTMEVEVVNVLPGVECGLRPDVCKVFFQVVCKVQTGIPSSM